MSGDEKAGFSVFWADEGLDTGPILLQRECEVLPNDTVDTIYNRFLYPEGVKAMVSPVQPLIPSILFVIRVNLDIVLPNIQRCICHTDINMKINQSDDTTLRLSSLILWSTLVLLCSL